MATPTIVFNNSTGSDSQSSGAGPGDGTSSGTKQFGTDASTDVGGTVVTVPNADLTDVDTTGLHAIFIDGGEGWRKITAKANSGTASANVTVNTAFTGSLTSQTYAIGGKRSSLDDAITDGLFATSGFEAGWGADIEYTGTNYDLTQAIGFNTVPAGNQTDGNLKIFSSSTTKPRIKRASTTNGDKLIQMDASSDYIRFWNLEFELTGTTGTVTLGHLDRAQGVTLRDCYFLMSGAASLLGIRAIGNFPLNVNVINCTFEGCDTGFEKENTGTSTIGGFCVLGCKFVDCDVSISAGDMGDITILNNLIYGTGTSGIKLFDGGQATIIGNTITGMSDDGIELLTSGQIPTVFIFGNIITGNSGYGINRNTADARDETWQIDYNCFGLGTGAGGANTSGATNNVTTGDNNVSLDPLFVNAPIGNYHLQPNSPVRYQGFPEKVGVL